MTLHDAEPGHVKLWQAVYEKLVHHEMPPEEEPEPDPLLKARVIDWIQNELAKPGREVRLGDDPSAGNRVNHEALFSGKHTGPSFSPPRLWRISPYISEARYTDPKRYGRYVSRGSQPFTLPPGPGIKDYAAIGQLDAPTLDLLMMNAEVLAQKQVEDPRFKTFTAASGTPTEQELVSMIRHQYQWVLLRQPDEEELSQALRFFQQSLRKRGRREGLRAMLMGILLSPDAVYRMELGFTEPDVHGRRRLSDMELAFALNYALRDTGPDASLLKDAAKGKLSDENVMRRHIFGMIDEELF
ncbi:MAG: DUF1592 domain-containing protein, partial [Verrucomicrobiota bacterium]